MKAKVFALTIISMIMLLVGVFGVITDNKAHNATILMANSQSNLDDLDIISIIEEQLTEKGTDVVSQLYEQIAYYNGILLTISIDNEDYNKIQSLINTTYEMISEYQAYTNPPSNPFGITTFSIFDDIKDIANYTYYVPQITAIIAGFQAQGWLLAAELLSHMLSNSDEWSHYYPTKKNTEFLTDTMFLNDASSRESITKGDAPVVNMATFPEYDKEAYYSIATFNYKKTYQSSTHVRIDIKDRYDYHHDGDYGSDFGKTLNEICYKAQNAGVLTRFYTIIENIIVPGFVPFKYEYQNQYNEAVITGAGNMTNITIPAYIRNFYQDFNVHPDEYDNYLRPLNVRIAPNALTVGSYTSLNDTTFNMEVYCDKCQKNPTCDKGHKDDDGTVVEKYKEKNILLHLGYPTTYGIGRTWSLPLIHNKVYLIRNAGSNLYMEVGGGATANGSRVRQYQYIACEYQKWRVSYDAKDGAYSFIPLHSPTSWIESHNMDIGISKAPPSVDFRKFYVVPLANGTYRILPKMAVTGGNNNAVGVSNGNTGNLQEYTYNANSLYHRWSFEDVSQGVQIQNGKIYQIKNMGLYLDPNTNTYINLCLEAGGTNTKNETIMTIYKQGTSENQKWKAIANTDGTFSFRPLHAPISYLESWQMKAKITTTPGTDLNRFYIVPVDKGQFKIVPKKAVQQGNNNAIAVANNTLNQQVEELAYSPNSANHHWEFVETEAGSQIQNGKVYYIQNYATEYYLAVKSASTGNGAAVIQFDYATSNNQKWKAVLNSDGTFSFIPQHATNMYLESISYNMKVYISNNSPHDGQRFFVTHYANNRYKVVPLKGMPNGNTMLAKDGVKNTQMTEAGYHYTNSNAYWLFKAV
jgi:hypothetical protein